MGITEDERTACFLAGLYLEEAIECQRCDDREDCKEYSFKLAKERGEATKEEKKRTSKVKDLVLRLVQDPQYKDFSCKELAENVRNELGTKTSAGSVSCCIHRLKKEGKQVIPRKRGRRSWKDQTGNLFSDLE